MQRDSVLDCAFDGIITMDAAGRIVEMNAAAERMFGYSREEAAGRELVPPIIPEELREGQRLAMGGRAHDEPPQRIGQRPRTLARPREKNRSPPRRALSPPAPPAAAL